MLNPRPVTDAIVSALASIAPLVTAMPNGIHAYHYQFGADKTLEQTIQQMKAGSILVAWRATVPGNFDGSTIWKHQFCVVIRIGNSANQESPLSYEDIWALMVNSPVNGGSTNILNYSINPTLDIMDTPGIIHSIDEDRMDFFQATFIYPEFFEA